MDPVVLAATSCLLQILDTHLEPTPEGWLETTLVEAAARPSCSWLEWPLPAGTTFVGWSGKARLGDGTKRKLVDERWDPSSRGLDGTASVRLHLPDLVGGDRIVVEVQRAWPPGPLAWAPGPFRFVSLQAGASQVEVSGLQRGDDGAWWSSESVAPTRATVGGDPPPPPLPPLPVGPVVEERRLTIRVPSGDPQVALFPGGGSQVRVERFLLVPPATEERALVVDLPAELEVMFDVRPPRAARIDRLDDHAVIFVDPSEAATRVALGWLEPDAPTYGARPPEVDELVVDAPAGLVQWEGDMWRLVGVNERPVLPTRAGLLKALDNRFRAQSLPEPGAPMDLRGQGAGWDLAAALRPTVLARSAASPHPADPLWPRKLNKARKSGLVSRTEAALIIWLYARQLRLDADWVVARPASRGPGAEHSPAGYTHALVRIAHDGEVRWIDPVCTVCGPFELPPDLQGASALSPEVDRTPAPTAGRVDVEVDGDGMARWTLTGPPALLLRLWLAELPGDRTRALAQRLGGPGAMLVTVDGIDRAGEPIIVQVQTGSGISGDPLALPVADAADTAWLEWVGVRTVRWPTHALPEVEITRGPLSYRREVADGHVQETLQVDARAVPGEALRAIEAARWGREADAP